MTLLSHGQSGARYGITPFFASPGAPAPPAIRGGRMFLGDCYQHGQQTDGNVTGGSWLQSFTLPEVTGPIDGWDYFEDICRAPSVSGQGGIGFSGVSRTSAALEAIGLVGAALNLGQGRKAWGAYLDAVSTSTASGITHGVEINATTLVASQLGGMTPYRRFTPRMTGGANIAIGSDAAVFGRSHEVDWTLLMQSNGGSALAGIVFRNGLLRREGETLGTTAPGNTGYAKAMLLPFQYGISMFSRDGTGVILDADEIEANKSYAIATLGDTAWQAIGAPAGAIVGTEFRATGPGTGTGTAVEAGTQQEVVRVFSSVVNSDVRWQQVFSDQSWDINEGVPSPSSLFRVAYVPDAVSRVQVTAGTASTWPGVEASGTAADISLRLQPKGTGGLIVPVASVPDFADVAAALASATIGIGRIFRVGTELHIKTEQT